MHRRFISTENLLSLKRLIIFNKWKVIYFLFRNQSIYFEICPNK